MGPLGNRAWTGRRTWSGSTDGPEWTRPIPGERRWCRSRPARQQLEARLGELKARLTRIEGELEQPVSDSFAEQATEREDEEVLEDLGAAGVQEVRMIEAALDRIATALRHLRQLRRADRRGAAGRAAGDADLPGLRRAALTAAS